MRLSVEERQQALEQRYPMWTPRTLHHALADAAARWPERDFVVTDEKSFSYSEIDDWSRRLAAGLIASGVRQGDHVALLLANYPEFVALKFAVSRVGATSVPINFLNRRDELVYVLEQSDARCLILMDRFRDLDYLGMLDEIIPDWPQQAGGGRLPELQSIFVIPVSQVGVPAGARSLADLVSAAGDAPDAAGDPEGISDIIYTSGTTGGPKGVMLTHDMLLRTAYGSAYGRAFEDARRILFSLPMYHVYGYVEGLLAALMVGGAVIIRRQFDPADTLRSVAKHRANDMLLIPTMTLALLDEYDRNDYSLPTLKAMLSSGGKSPAPIWERIFTTFGQIEATTGYGMTEATASSTVTRPDDPIDRLRYSNGRLRDVGAAGDPANDGKLVAYRVVDSATDKELPLGTMGELRMKGLGVTKGYYKKAEETKAALDTSGWFRTGDLGTLDAEGYITLTGRSKESYRCGGELVLPLEVENLLATHPAIDEVHVVAIADPRMGEVGVACVLTPGEPAVQEKELIDYCSERLARFKVPRHVLFIKPEDLPTTPTGRPRKFLLAQRVQQILDASAEGKL